MTTKIKRYEYTFIVRFHALYRDPLVFKTQADTDLEAMMAYCGSSRVQDLNMRHIREVVMTHREQA